MFVRSPEAQEFIIIFKRFCQSQQISCDEKDLEDYLTGGISGPRRCSGAARRGT
jgi:hypothetical protein